MRNRPARLFPPFVTGMLGAALVAVLVAMTPPVQEALAWIRVSGTVRVPGIPLAKDMVRIDSGAPFVVPTGRFLRVYAVGVDFLGVSGSTIKLTIGASTANFLLLSSTFQELGPGFAVPPGTQVSMAPTGSTPTYALGALEDA